MASASAVMTSVSPIMVMTVMISSAGALRDSRIRLAIDTSMFDTALPEAARRPRLASAMTPVKTIAANRTISTERGFSGDTARAKRCHERPRFFLAQAETRARR